MTGIVAKQNVSIIIKLLLYSVICKNLTLQILNLLSFKDS